MAVLTKPTCWKRVSSHSETPPGLQNRVGTSTIEIILTQHKTQEPGWWRVANSKSRQV